MARKKKGGYSGKKAVRRVDPRAEKRIEPRKQEVPEPEKPRIAERIREKDAGFGVIKVAAGVLVVLILGSGVLLKLLGGDEAVRGDKIAGETCESTQECERGNICYSYREDAKRCMKTCPNDKDCPAGHTCTSAAERSGRKSTRVRAVCVEDSKL